MIKQKVKETKKEKELTLAFKAELTLHQNMIEKRNIEIGKLRVKNRDIELALFKAENKLSQTERELRAIKEALIIVIGQYTKPNAWNFSTEPRIFNVAKSEEKESPNE